MACAQRSASLKTTLCGTFVSSESIVETLIRQPPVRDTRASPRAPPAARPRAQSPLLPPRVARLGFVVHGIEAGKLRPALDLEDNKALHALVLGALLSDEGEKVLRDHHGSVVVADDDVAGKDRAATAADRLLPSDEGEAIDVGRGSSPGAPDRQLGGKHALLVAHDA